MPLLAGVFGAFLSVRAYLASGAFYVMALTAWMLKNIDAWSTEEAQAMWRRRLLSWLVASACTVVSMEALFLLRARGIWIPPVATLIFYLIPIATRFLRFIYPGSFPSWVAGTAILFSSMQMLESAKRVDLFEGSNHGIAIFDFFAYGMIPVLQNFDAHMFSNTGLGILYGWMTGDMEGAWHSPLSCLYAIPILLSVYFVFRRFLAEEIVTAVVLFTPAFVLFDNAFLLGIVLAAYFVYWMRLGGLRWDAGFALCFLLSCFFRLDVGASWGLAFELSAVLYLMNRERRGRLIPFLLVQVMAGSAVLAGIVWAGNSIGLDWNAFLQSFHEVASSNQHWSYGRWGNIVLVAAVYFALPVLLAALLIRYGKNVISNWDSPQGMILLFLLLSGLFNVQRTLVRHSMSEHNFVTWGIPLIFTVLFLAWTDERKRKLWLEAMLLFIVLLTSKFGIKTGGAILPDAIVHVGAVYQSADTKQTTAVLPDAQRKQVIDDLSAFFAPRLHGDQTYLDFTDQSLLYAYLGKKNPCYVNQTPAMLNGKSAQEDYLKTLREMDVPYVLMPYEQGKETQEEGYSCFASIDNIQNTDRFYLLMEHIGANYEPYCRVDDFVIWAKKGAASAEMPLPADAEELCSYDYNDASYYERKLGWIPYLWGTFGKEPLSGMAQELSLNDMNVETTGAGGLLLEIASEGNAEADFAVQTANASAKMATYHFRIKKGTHRYYFRLSSDVLWYADAHHEIQMELPAAATVERVAWISKEDAE